MGVPSASDTALIGSGTVIVNQPVSVGTLTNNATLRFSGWGSTLSARDVIVNGTIDQAGPSTSTSNGVHVVCTNLTIANSGKIDVTGKGYAGGNSSHANGYGTGGGKGSAGFATGGGGGGYGAEGGYGSTHSAGTVYGSVTNPIAIGSGGGNGYINGSGGAGGGAIRLAVRSALTINGSILADGVTGSVPSYKGGSGGGSGGSVWLDAGSMAGTGPIQASGGNRTANGANGGGGGGGRIAIFYGTSTFTGTTRARGNGVAPYIGGAGTLYVDPAASLPTLTLDNGKTTLSGATPGTWMDNTVLNGLSTLIINNCGILKHAAGSTNGVNATIPTVALGTYGSIDVSGRGYAGGLTGHQAGYGTGGGAGTSSFAQSGGGGGYGGAGGAGSVAGGVTYGVSNAPVHLGSGGGNGYTGGAGGAGGGALKLTTTTLTLDGSVLANGAAGVTPTYRGGTGGGSGGSIWIIVRAFTGTGMVRARGGSGTANDIGAGGGGGGRIAFFYRSGDPAPLAFSVTGGSGANAGGLGTICLEQTRPEGSIFVFR